MFGITAALTGAAVLALLATLMSPLAGAPGTRTLIVAADGSADHTTITDAVGAASDGDTVLVRPGEYTEALIIDKDITVAGDGPRDEIVVRFLEGSTATDMEGTPVYLPIVLEGVDAELRGLTVHAPARGGGVLVDGGAPLLADIAVTTDEGAYGAVALGGESRPVVRDSWFAGDVITDSDGTSPTLEGNSLIGRHVFSLNGPGEVLVRGNRFPDGGTISASDGLTGVIEGNDLTGGDIGVDSGSDLTVRDNVLRSGDVQPVGVAAIHVDGGSALIEGNSITGMPLGIRVTASADTTVASNQLVDNRLGIAWSSMAPGAISGNHLEGGASGLVISAGSPEVTGNSVEGVTGRGITVGTASSPTLTGNTVCGCGTNLWLSERATPEIGENDICAEPDIS
jgi:parallel beta-helix repeat protein